MSTNLRRSLLALAALAALTSADAQTPPARRPGQWEVRQGPAGGPTGPAVHICMRPAEAGGEFRGLGRGAGAPGSTFGSACDYQRLSTSASEVRWRNVCRSDGDTLTLEGRAYDIHPESFKADMTLSGLGGRAGTVHAEARWLSSACGDVKQSRPWQRSTP